MSSTGPRLLRLLSLFQRRRLWSGAELCSQLEVSERTLRRDVERLRELGYPVEARRGVDGGYALAAGATLPPLMLDDEEAIALGVGLRLALQGEPVTGIAEASVRALAKVLKVMPVALRRRVDTITAMTVPGALGAQPAVDMTDLAVVAQACRDGEQLEFAYTARDTSSSDRRVEPHRVVLLGRRWYLVAFDLTRFDWRTFRLDRIDLPRTVGGRCLPRALPAEDVVEFVRSSIEGLWSGHVVEAVVHARAEAVRSQIGTWASVEKRDQGTSLVTISTESFEWAFAALSVTGAPFQVLSPPEAIDHLARWSERAAEALAVSKGRSSIR